MNFWQSLTGRLFKLVFGWYLALAITVTAVQLGLEYSTISRAINDDLESLGRSFAPSVADAVWSFDRPQLAAMAKGIVQATFVTGVQVESAKGEAIALAGAIPDPGARGGESLLAAYQRKEFPLAVTAPRGERRLVGRLLLYCDRTVAIERLQYSFFVILVNSLIKTAGLWLIFYLVITRGLARPLARLTDVVSRVEFATESTQPIAIGYPHGDELGRLMEAMLKMQRRVAAAREEIDGINRNLEWLVAERTRELRESEQRLSVALTAANEAWWDWDMKSGNAVLSPSYYTMLGYDIGEFPPNYDQWRSRVHPDDIDAVESRQREALTERGEGHVDVEFRMRTRSDTWRWMGSHAAVAARDETGRPARLIGTIRDITAQKEAEEKLRLAANVFSNSLDGIVITDPNGTVVDANPAFVRLTGYAREEIIGQNPRLLSSGRHDRDFYAAMWQCILYTGQWSGEIWNRRKNGEIYPERLAITTVRGDGGRTSHYVGVFSDISVVKHQEEQLVHLAQHDALTGIPNRVLLADRMRQAIAQTRRNGGLLAICYLDLDGFKPVNDRFGHDVGDRLLIEMARRMEQTLRGGDTVARLGGDEFVCLLLGLKDVRECEASLDRILACIARPLLAGDALIGLSASIGVSLYPIDDEAPDTLLRHADQAMYTAKQSGRNRYHFYDLEGDRRTRDHRETQDRVRQAMNHGELELHYQPKIDMRSGRVAGAEALIRWRHPERGLLMPAEFLPIIENTALDIALGEWVLAQVLGQLDTWRRAGLDLDVSVNISAHHIRQGGFVDMLKAQFAAYPDVSAARLELEIQETAALEDLGRISETIRTCGKLGSGFSLDDFGTGYSSLTCLKRLPVQSLKIDQSFVRDMLRNPDDLAIVEGVIALAEAFGRDVVAEGVDSLESGLLLLQLGCQIAQGYSIAHPMPPGQIPAWIAAWQSPNAWSEENFRRWRKEDFALLLAEYHHREWIDSLTDRIEGAEHKYDPLMLDPDSCHFGRWYRGSGLVRYGHLEEFRALDATHRQVHELGRRLLVLLRDNRAGEAQEGLAQLFALRDDLLIGLHALQTRVLQNGRPGH